MQKDTQKSDDGHQPVMEEVASHDTESVVAVVGHPVHSMMVHFPIALVIGGLAADLAYWFTGDDFWLRAGIWATGLAFFAGLASGLAGTAELLLVKGIRLRIASWTHAVAAMTLLSIAGTNWGLRMADAEAVLPHGLALSGLAAVFTGLTGWHGGKLIFDHGVGIMVSPKS